MSLQTERIFLAALRASEDVTKIVGDRIYAIAIPGDDIDVDNTTAPYLVVTFDGFQNNVETKDDPYEGSEDKVQIGITVAAESPDDLCDLAELVRDTIDNYMIGYVAPEEGEDLSSLIPTGYDITGSEKSYDWLKPCYLMILHYSCDTDR